jgi:phosphatidylcholine synthase
MNTDRDPDLPPSPPRGRRLLQCLGWFVHFYTALGLVAAAGIAVLIVRGGHESFRLAFALMLVATLIDSTDGLFARAVRIKEVIPSFDGRRLDDIVDFLTYSFLPLLLIWRAGILPAGYEPCLLVPLLASAYGFCQVAAKTDDGYFLGFPSYWNLVAFHLYLLHAYIAPLPGWFSVGLIIGLALLTFAPTRYLYPSQRSRLNVITRVLGAAWTVLLVWILYYLPTGGGDFASYGVPTKGLILASLLFPAYYMVASWVVSLRIWRARRGAKGSAQRGDVTP